MDNYQKLIGKLRKSKTEFTEISLRLTSEIIELGIELAIAENERTNKLEKHTKQALLFEKLKRIPNQKFNIKRKLKQDAIENGAFSLVFSIFAIIIASIFTTSFATALSVAAVVFSTIFLTSTIITSIKPLKLLLEILQLERKYNFDEEKQKTLQTQQELDKASKKADKLHEAKDKKVAKKEKISRNLSSIDRFITQIDEAKLIASTKLGRYTSETSLNKVYYCDERINEILRLERKMKHDN